MRQAQITIDTPQGVTAAKFQLFQRVSTKTTTGIITGMEYISFTDALVRELSNFGWSYTVNFLYDMSEKQLLEADEEKAVEQFWENSLRLAEEVIQ